MQSSDARAFVPQFGTSSGRPDIVHGHCLWKKPHRRRIIFTDKMHQTKPVCRKVKHARSYLKGIIGKTCTDFVYCACGSQGMLPELTNPN